MSQDMVHVAATLSAMLGFLSTVCSRNKDILQCFCTASAIIHIWHT